MEKPQVISGGVYTDLRGSLVYNNNFTIDVAKRTYTLIHPEIGQLRAWQAHKVEEKWMQVLKGSFLIVLVALTNFNDIQSNGIPQEYILKEKTGDVLYIPGGYANGLLSLERNSILQVYSGLSLQDAAYDNFKFDSHLWYNWHIKRK